MNDGFYFSTVLCSAVDVTIFMKLVLCSCVDLNSVCSVWKAVSRDLACDSSVSSEPYRSTGTFGWWLGLYFLIKTGYCILKLLPVFAAYITTEFTCHLPVSNWSWSFYWLSCYSLRYNTYEWLRLPRSSSSMRSISDYYFVVALTFVSKPTECVMWLYPV